MSADEMIRFLDELGERLGPAGEKAWALAMRQVYLEVAAFGLLGLLCIAVAIVVWRWSNGEDRWEREPARFVSLWVLGLGTIILIAVVVTLLNPEFGAMAKFLP